MPSDSPAVFVVVLVGPTFRLMRGYIVGPAFRCLSGYWAEPSGLLRHADGSLSYFMAISPIEWAQIAVSKSGIGLLQLGSSGAEVCCFTAGLINFVAGGGDAGGRYKPGFRPHRGVICLTFVSYCSRAGWRYSDHTPMRPPVRDRAVSDRLSLALVVQSSSSWTSIFSMSAAAGFCQFLIWPVSRSIFRIK